MTALGMSLLRGAVTSPFKRAGGPGATLPTDREVLPATPTAPAPLAAYRELCGFTDPETLPLTYPHVLGFPLAMRLMTRRSFPLPVLGLVHTWIEITAHRPPRPQDRLELTVYAAELTPHRRGTEVTVVTEARCAGETVWESRSGYLSRHAASGATGGTAARPQGAPVRADAPVAAETAPPDASAAGAGLPALAEWRLPGDLGRRYGAVSGDRNPIHLHPLTARLFGFPGTSPTACGRSPAASPRRRRERVRGPAPEREQAREQAREQDQQARNPARGTVAGSVPYGPSSRRPSCCPPPSPTPPPRTPSCCAAATGSTSPAPWSASADQGAVSPPWAASHARASGSPGPPRRSSSGWSRPPGPRHRG